MNRYSVKWVGWTLALLAWHPVALAGAEQGVVERHWVTPDDNARHWAIEERNGIRVELFQRFPDQTRAFYEGRGFPPGAADLLARACVVQGVVSNDSENANIATNLAEWRVVAGGREQPLRLEPDWQQQWQKMGIPQSARVTFRFTMLPASQSLNPRDWLQGMITLNQPFGEKVDVKVRWSENGVAREAILHAVECAKDISRRKQ